MSRLVRFLAAATGLSELDVQKIIARAPVSYKEYKIPKRNGGERLISQPAREVKSLQRAVIKGLSRLSIHHSATAYRAGTSIRSNAERHAQNGPILKFDFSDFFHSIKSSDWKSYCEKYSVFLESEDIELSSKLLFRRVARSGALRLAIGAPSSPWLSNVIMLEFDSQVSEFSAKEKVTYTRYADDITFSARRTGYLNSIERMLRKVVRNISSPDLTLNENKTVLVTKRYRRVVTGLVLADDGRVTLGRDRKRALRAGMHNASLALNTPDQNVYLGGMIAFAHDIEPNFVSELIKKYNLSGKKKFW